MGHWRTIKKHFESPTGVEHMTFPINRVMGTTSRGLRFFLCPTLMACRISHLCQHQIFLNSTFVNLNSLSCEVQDKARFPVIQAIYTRIVIFVVVVVVVVVAVLCVSFCFVLEDKGGVSIIKSKFNFQNTAGPEDVKVRIAQSHNIRIPVLCFWISISDSVNF